MKGLDICYIMADAAENGYKHPVCGKLKKYRKQRGVFMDDIIYKEYTEEETRIYNEVMVKIREGLKNGLTLKEACGAVAVADAELKKLISDDVLKIMIAEMHFGKGLTLEEVAKALSVSLKAINAAIMEMLEDAGIAAAEEYNKNNPNGHVGNA